MQLQLYYNNYYLSQHLVVVKTNNDDYKVLTKHKGTLTTYYRPKASISQLW